MKISYWAACLIIIIGCNTKQPEHVTANPDTSISTKTDTGNIFTDAHFFWNADWDQQKGFIMKKVSPLPDDSLTPPLLIEKLNSLYPEIQLRFRKISGDTIFLSIDNSRYLTTQIGSTGAKGYLAEATYNLTEVKNINFVDILFKEGDHAAPGTYTRTDFIK